MLHRLFLPRYGPPPPVESSQADAHVQPALVSARGAPVVVYASAASSDPKRVAILCHPLTRWGPSYFLKSRLLAFYLSDGWDVALFPFNGFHPVPFRDFYFYEDVIAVISCLRQRYSRLLLHGRSFGSLHSIRATSHLPAETPIVLEALSPSLNAYWKHFPLPYTGLLCLQALRLRFVRQMHVRHNLELAARGKYVHIVSGANDKYAPQSAMRELATTTGASLHILPGVAHCDGEQANPEAYFATLRAIAL